MNLDLKFTQIAAGQWNRQAAQLSVDFDFVTMVDEFSFRALRM